MAIASAVAISLVVLSTYCAIDPFSHSPIKSFPDFEAVKVDMPPWSEIPTDRDASNMLQNSEVMNGVQGPESIVFDSHGRGPYTGVADGRILFWDGVKWTDFAYTSPNRSDLCNPKSTPLSYMKNEHICGRPLGLRFCKKTGDLYVADAYFGLMKVGQEGGLATPLTTEAEGVPLRFTNDLDIDDDGSVYFTDSSAKYERRNFMQLIFSSEDSGRFLKYDPSTEETSVLVRNLQFPNGVSLSKDRNYVVFCESSVGRLRKYWLKGEKAGTSEVLAILPGFPDNVRVNEKGEFWVALHCRRAMYAYMCALYPKIRHFLLKLPVSGKFHYWLQIGGRPHAAIIKLDGEGKLLRVLEDSSGKVVRAVSEAEEKDGKLWIGSVLMSFIAVYKL